MEVRVVDDPAAELAEMLVQAAAAGEQIVMTGGSTPKRAYELAAGRQGDWSGATLWFGDDRCVPADHELSNHRLVHDALVSRLPDGGRPEVLRMQGELGPGPGAAAYDALVRERMGEDPAWDLLLLGLGPDAHCASLFPGKPEVQERSRLVTGVPEAGWDPRVPRITMTLPCLNAAKRVVFLVTGADKAPAMRRAFGEPPDPSSPAAHVRPGNGTGVVLCDAAAAQELEI